MSPSNCKHESHQRRNAAASLPPRSGGPPLHYPQGGVHSLAAYSFSIAIYP
jgi:hypothetical protein